MLTYTSFGIITFVDDTINSYVDKGILFQILAMKLSKSYCKEVISPEVVSRCLHSPQYVDLRSDFRDNYDVDLEVEINNLLKEVS